MDFARSSVSPEERLRLLKEEERRRRKELEEELARKRKELEELERRKQREEEELEELEEETLEDLAAQREHIAELERKLTAVKGGAGEPRDEPRDDLQALVQQAQQGVEYLISTTLPEERRREVERDLYSTVQAIREQVQAQPVDESYVFNKLQEDLQKMKHGDDFYVQRMQKALNDILQYTP